MRVIDLATPNRTSQSVGSDLCAKELPEVASAKVSVRNAKRTEQWRAEREILVQPKDKCLLALPVKVGNVEWAARRDAALISGKARFGQAVVVVEPQIGV